MNKSIKNENARNSNSYHCENVIRKFHQACITYVPEAQPKDLKCCLCDSPERYIERIMLNALSGHVGTVFKSLGSHNNSHIVTPCVVVINQPGIADGVYFCNFEEEVAYRYADIPSEIISTLMKNKKSVLVCAFLNVKNAVLLHNLSGYTKGCIQIGRMIASLEHIATDYNLTIKHIDVQQNKFAHALGVNLNNLLLIAVVSIGE